jgi:hypothetical protein
MASEERELLARALADQWLDDDGALSADEITIVARALLAALEREKRLREALTMALDCKGSYNGTVSQLGGDPALCTKCEEAARLALKDAE